MFLMDILIPLMAEPATIALVAVAISAVSAGVGTYAAVEQGNVAKEAAKRSAEAEKANARAAMDAAALEAGQVRRKNLLRLGAQRAAAAKSGVLIDDSAADVIYDTAIQGELEALSVLYSGAQAASYSRSRGKIALAEGKAAKSASRIQASSTLIGGLGSAATSYSQANRSPTFTG